jgi:hypothetical protein
MDKSPTWLLDFRHNVFSQTGEDGIIEKILGTIGETDRWCVEFGAWDGKHLSNTRNLIEHHDYSAVLLEGSKEKFRQLEANCRHTEKVIPLNQYVGFGDEDNLDKILSATPVPVDFDLLSIDIDGNDFHVWKAMSVYRPKVVCVEFNPTIPTEVRFVQRPDPRVNQGCSLLALVDLAKEKGYQLISVLPFNAFFVLGKYYGRFSLPDNRPAILRTDLSNITYIFSGYDGTLFLDGHRRLPWHGIGLKEERIQHLPRLLQKYPSVYGPLSRTLFFLYSALLSRLSSDTKSKDTNRDNESQFDKGAER